MHVIFGVVAFISISIPWPARAPDGTDAALMVACHIDNDKLDLGLRNTQREQTAEGAR